MYIIHAIKNSERYVYLTYVTNQSVTYMFFSHVVNPMITTNPMSQQVGNGDMVTFTCIAMAFPAPSYNWSTPNTINFNTSTISFVALYSSAGNYICMATSNGTVVKSQPAVLTGN